MMAEKEQDMVNHPKHYNESGIECIDALEAMLGDGFESYLQGNIVKYLLMKVKIMVTLSVDPDEYPVPSDGDVTEDFEDYMRELFHDLEGVKISHIKVLTE